VIRSVHRRPDATIAVFRVDAGGNMTFVGDRDVCGSPRFARMAIDQ
jgi:hypothetical protein